MLLVLEIMLTVAAWRKGWRWLALVPPAVGVTVGMLIGVLMAVAGFTPAEARKASFFLLPLDLVLIGILGWMTYKGREIQAAPVQEGVTASPRAEWKDAA